MISIYPNKFYFLKNRSSKLGCLITKLSHVVVFTLCLLAGNDALVWVILIFSEHSNVCLLSNARQKQTPLLPAGQLTLPAICYLSLQLTSCVVHTFVC